MPSPLLPSPQMLLKADIRENFTSEELNLERQSKQTELSPKSGKHETKVYANLD